MTKAYHKNDVMQVNMPTDCKTFICDKFFKSYSVYVVSVLSREMSCFYLLFDSSMDEIVATKACPV